MENNIHIDNADLKTEVAIIYEKLKTIDQTLTEIKTKLDEDYVKHEEFAPVKSIAFGLVGTIVLGVVGALVAMVLQK